MEPDSRRSESCGRLSSRDLDLARKLRQREDRNVQLLRQRLQIGGDLGDLLHAVLRGAPARAGDELQVVDDQEVEAALPLQPARAGGELADRDAAGLVDVERDALHLLRHLDDAVELILVDGAAADVGGGDARLLGEDAGRELLGRHFQREEADDAAVDGLDRAVGLLLAAPGARDVVGDVGGERRLAHAGAAGEDDQVGVLQAAHQPVEVVEPGGEAGQVAGALDRRRPPCRWRRFSASAKPWKPPS